MYTYNHIPGRYNKLLIMLLQIEASALLSTLFFDNFSFLISNVETCLHFSKTWKNRRISLMLVTCLQIPPSLSHFEFLQLPHVYCADCELLIDPLLQEYSVFFDHVSIICVFVGENGLFECLYHFHATSVIHGYSIMILYHFHFTSVTINHVLCTLHVIYIAPHTKFLALLRTRLF